jgi:undecaprenyl pyrophosphate phosphatase UppP
MHDFLRNLAEMDPFSAFLRGLAGLGTTVATLTVKYTDALEQYNILVSFVASIIALISAVFGVLYLRQAWKNAKLQSVISHRALEVSEKALEETPEKSGQGQERAP